MEVLYMFRCLAVVFSLLLASPAVAVEQPVTVLEKGSFVRFNDDVNSSSASRFLSVSESDSVLVFIDSPGGDVLSGLRMVEVVRSAKIARPGLRVTCFVQSAASMAFYFVQLACDERVLGPTSILMQHQASLGMQGKWGEVQSRSVLVTQIVDWLDREVSARLGLSVEKYRLARSSSPNLPSVRLSLLPCRRSEG
jgi:ATP-dependent protease ClpP protease subunit